MCATEKLFRGSHCLKRDSRLKIDEFLFTHRCGRLEMATCSLTLLGSVLYPWLWVGSVFDEVRWKWCCALPEPVLCVSGDFQVWSLVGLALEGSWHPPWERVIMVPAPAWNPSENSLAEPGQPSVPREMINYHEATNFGGGYCAAQHTGGNQHLSMDDGWVSERLSDANGSLRAGDLARHVS